MKDKLTSWIESHTTKPPESTYEKLQTQNEKLRACVEFYADKENWYLDDADWESGCMNDGDTGERARKCLAELEGEK